MTDMESPPSDDDDDVMSMDREPAGVWECGWVAGLTPPTLAPIPTGPGPGNMQVLGETTAGPEAAAWLTATMGLSAGARRAAGRKEVEEEEDEGRAPGSAKGGPTRGDTPRGARPQGTTVGEPAHVRAHIGIGRVKA
jgi:hypothetical protein